MKISALLTKKVDSSFLRQFVEPGCQKRISFQFILSVLLLYQGQMYCFRQES